MRRDGTLNTEKYISALDSARGRNMNNTEKERIALVYSAIGSNDSYVKSVVESDFGSTGINGIAYGLMLLDSGAYVSTKNDRDALISKLISSQLTDGGWALTGTASNIDITAMALQALAPYKSYDDVSSAVSKALAFLSAKQDPNGGYQSLGKPTCESTAQVAIALTALGIDPQKDARFIKNSADVFDALAKYQLADGSYSHFQSADKNLMSTAQALMALVAAERFYAGKSPLMAFTSKSIGRSTETSGNSVCSAYTEQSSEAADNQQSQEGEAAKASSESSESSVESESYSAADPVINGMEKATKRISYKYFICGGIILLFAVISAILFAKGKGGAKNILPLAGIAVLLICAVLFINITSVKEHYSVNSNDGTTGDNTVYITIDCRNIPDKDNSVPENGLLLSKAQTSISDGDTAFDALLSAARNAHIKIDYTGSPDNPLTGVYVNGIGNIYEMQFGPLSGWIYKVNGTVPEVGCGSYKLSPGDTVEFIYTLDLGKDAEADD